MVCSWILLSRPGVTAQREECRTAAYQLNARNLSGAADATLGGSWVVRVVISGVISRVTIVMITHSRGPITPLMTTHEPPSKEMPLPVSWLRSEDRAAGSGKIQNRIAWLLLTRSLG